MTGAEGDLGGDTVTSSTCTSFAASGGSATDMPRSSTSVSETDLLVSPWGPGLEPLRPAPAAVPLADLRALGEVGDTSSMLLVSLSSAPSWSSEMTEPSVRESSSSSSVSGRPSSSPSSSTRRRWPMSFLRRGTAAMTGFLVGGLSRDDETADERGSSGTERGGEGRIRDDHAAAGGGREWSGESARD